MSQYFIDSFQTADLSDFEQISDSNAHTITAGTFDSKDCLVISKNYGDAFSLAYTPAGTAADYEICALVRITVRDGAERIGPAGNLVTGSVDAYLGTSINDAVGFCRLDAGVRSLRTANYAVRHDPTLKWVWYRLRKSGSDFKVRFWAENDTEPTTWSIETSDSGTLLTTGKLGLAAVTTDSNDYVAALGIGTNGDTAPTEAVPTGLTIDSTDATMQRGTNFEVVCSTPSTAPTTANTTLSNGNDTLTPSSVTGSDPYTLTFAIGDLTKQVDATGYDWTLEITP